jgi:hypothetical protein
MSLVSAIQSSSEELVAKMISVNNRETGTSEADTRQFVVGYVNILSAAAGGDLGPRDEYLASVIPAIRDAGMPLGVVIDGMVRVSTVAGALLGAEHLPWLCDFQGAYSARIIEIWQAR